MEEWKTISEFPKYEVSNTGRVRRIGSTKDRVATATPYPTVTFSKNGRTVNRRVHRLVAIAFLGDPPNPEQSWVLHADDDPTNNYLSNLRWGRGRDNSADMMKNLPQKRLESKCPAKLSEAQVQHIRASRAAGESTYDIALRMGVTATAVQQLVKGRTWRHVPIDTQIQQTLAAMHRPKGYAAKIRAPRKNDVLTIDLVREIRRLCAEGIMQKDISVLLGVNKGSVSDVICGRAWKNQL